MRIVASTDHAGGSRKITFSAAYLALNLLVSAACTPPSPLPAPISGTSIRRDSVQTHELPAFRFSNQEGRYLLHAAVVTEEPQLPLATTRDSSSYRESFQIQLLARTDSTAELVLQPDSGFRADRGDRSPSLQPASPKISLPPLRMAIGAGASSPLPQSMERDCSSPSSLLTPLIAHLVALAVTSNLRMQPDTVHTLSCTGQVEVSSRYMLTPAQRQPADSTRLLIQVHGDLKSDSSRFLPMHGTGAIQGSVTVIRLQGRLPSSINVELQTQLRFVSPLRTQSLSQRSSFLVQRVNND